MGREQISLECVVSARSDSATLGLPPAHGVCAFPVYTAQTLGCSAGTCLMWALVCMHFRGISRAGSGSRVLTKVQTWLGLCFAPVPCLSSSSDQVLGVRSCPQLKAATYPLPRPSFSVFWVYNGHGSQVCRVSLLGSWSLAATLPADVHHPESQEVLVSKEGCLQFGIRCLSGAAIAPFRLWLPSPACLRWGMGWSTAS